MKTVAIVQARTTSERFPCKVFAALDGRPLLAHVLERAAAIRGVDRVVLAVPENDVRLMAHLWPDIYGGSEKDVLGRYAGATAYYEADIIIRITGDCPLLAPDLIGDALLVFHADNHGYMAMCQPYTPVADGWDAEIFDQATIKTASREAKKSQREHVTTWMRDSRDDTNVLCFPDWEDSRALKCSVDTREDLRRVEKIMQHLTNKKDFTHHATWAAWEKAGRP